MTKSNLDAALDSANYWSAKYLELRAAVEPLLAFDPIYRGSFYCEEQITKLWAELERVMGKEAR